MCGSSLHFNVVQPGNLAIDIKFSNAPTAAVSLVCYGEFENTIYIDAESAGCFQAVSYLEDWTSIPADSLQTQIQAVNPERILLSFRGKGRVF